MPKLSILKLVISIQLVPFQRKVLLTIVPEAKAPEPPALTQVGALLDMVKTCPLVPVAKPAAQLPTLPTSRLPYVRGIEGNTAKVLDPVILVRPLSVPLTILLTTVAVLLLLDTGTYIYGDPEPLEDIKPEPEVPVCPFSPVSPFSPLGPGI